MAKPSARRRHKERKRQERKKMYSLHVEKQKHYVDSYPKIVLKNTKLADPAFVVKINECAKKIKFDDPELFSKEERQLWREFNNGGHDRLDKLIKDENRKEFNPLAVYISNKLGQIIFDMVGPAQLIKWLPLNDVAVCLGENIVLYFRGLLCEPSPTGTIYYSRRKPTVNYNGEHQTIGFSIHAINKICLRLVQTHLTYGASGDVFAFLDQCTRFDLIPLPNGQPGITFYSPCKSQFFGSRYLPVWEGEIRGDRNYYYRIGYCPIVFENGFAKAKTLLLPGYRNTPEYSALIKDVDLSVGDQNRMIRHATGRQAEMKTDVDLVAWFHRNGVPQIIETQGELYSGIRY